jgi:hypothetical protein
MRLTNDKRYFLHKKFADSVLYADLATLEIDFDALASEIQTLLDVEYAKADAIADDDFTRRMFRISKSTETDYPLFNQPSTRVCSAYNQNVDVKVKNMPTSSIKGRYVINSYYRISQQLTEFLGDAATQKVVDAQEQINNLINSKRESLESIVKVIDACDSVKQVQDRIQAVKAMIPQSWYDEEKQRLEQDRLRREQRKREREIEKAKRELNLRDTVDLTDIDRAVAVARMTGDL